MKNRLLPIFILLSLAFAAQIRDRALVASKMKYVIPNRAVLPAKDLLTEILGCDLRDLTDSKEYVRLYRVLDRAKYVLRSHVLQKEFLEISGKCMQQALNESDIQMYTAFLPVYNFSLPWIIPRHMDKAEDLFDQDEGALLDLAEIIRGDSIMTSILDLIEEDDHSRLYEIKEELGAGTFGTVYSAERLDNRELVAIKRVVSNKQGSFPTNQIVELKVLKHRIHPAVLHSIDSWIDPLGALCIVTKLYDGDLFELIESGLLDKVTVTSIAKGLLEGLVALHSRGIIHRDIKEENIFWDTDGNVVLADLGACFLCQGPEHTPKRIVGTPEFMARELVVFRSAMANELAAMNILKSTYDSKIDIWSLGAVLLELYTGMGVYAEMENVNIYEAIIHETPLEHCEKSSGNILPDPEVRNFLAKFFVYPPAFRPSALELLNDPFVQQYGEADLAEFFTYYASTKKVSLDGTSDEEILDR